MYVYTIVVIWYTVSGHQSQIVADRRIHAPWYLFDSDPPSCRTPIWAYTT
jgi:hypothetical protein